jgi:hypothetical protein
LFIWILRLRLRLLNLEGMQEPEFFNNTIKQQGKLETNSE